MLYYPQLSSGSIAQYAIRRNNIRRTLVNLLPDGTQIPMTDPGAAAVSWTLMYSHLNSAEVSGLQGLFASTLGRWQTFTFVDPTDNLLQWSEDLSQAVWSMDPLLAISGGVADPTSGISGWRVVNNAQADQLILQRLSIPPGYQYCFSAYVRADAPCSFSLIANSSELPASATAAWTRVVFSCPGVAGAGSVATGVSLPAGCSLELFGLQLEAQPGPGAYKKTRDIAGVYPSSRFDQDELTTTATSLGQFEAMVKILSNVAG